MIQVKQIHNQLQINDFYISTTELEGVGDCLSAFAEKGYTKFERCDCEKKEKRKNGTSTIAQPSLLR